MPKDNHPPFTWLSLSDGANFPMWVSLSELWVSLSELANMGVLVRPSLSETGIPIRVLSAMGVPIPRDRTSYPRWVSLFRVSLIRALIRGEWVAGAGAFMECEGAGHYSGGP